MDTYVCEWTISVKESSQKQKKPAIASITRARVGFADFEWLVT